MKTNEVSRMPEQQTAHTLRATKEEAIKCS